jgi:hypothetical protein
LNLKDFKLGIRNNIQDKTTDYNTNKSGGYSTDIEQLARSK